MRQEDLNEHLKRLPFQPFGIHLSTGEHFLTFISRNWHTPAARPSPSVCPLKEISNAS